MKTLLALIAAGASALAVAPAAAADALPKSGEAKLAAYTVCRLDTMIDMGPLGSQSAADCTAVVKTTDGSKLFDDLAMHCLEEAKARPDGYRFFGTCLQTDADGDKIGMSYEGPESGPVEWFGGTGKYKDIRATGTWSVADAPGNTAQLFVFTFSYQVSWTMKAP